MKYNDSEDLLGTLSRGKWKRIGTKKRAGVMVPLFSVFSKKSVGIGDLQDLRLLIDWCHKTGNSILQLLPMNEVGSTYCPYDAISSFALEPAYISLDELPAADKKALRPKIDKIRKAFPAGERHVDYRIKNEKRRLLWEAYSADEIVDLRDFGEFIDINSYWIDDFALFKALKEHHKGRPWYEWEPEYRDRDRDALAEFAKKNEKLIIFEKWMQWIAVKQFKAASDYAHSKGILLKGDLPILISRDSADVWAHLKYFKLDLASGAPPDMYCAKGQRWGAPTYEWGAIASDGYKYLKEKLRFAQNFYDLLRVDHVVGLFRIWSIPYNDAFENIGLNGFFDPSDEGLWREHGSSILSVMLESTDMLLCAEDLGMIPSSCPEILKEYGIPGNDVQRWVKDWGAKHDFLPPEDYRHIAVAMLSTHDTTNWAAWWEDEAGTIDEELFIRKANERGIDHKKAIKKLFDPAFSKHGRLRWRDAISASEKVAKALGKPIDEIGDFIELYENSYREKDKLWKRFKIRAPMREKADPEIVRNALKVTLGSNAIFCIELMIDYLYLTDMLKGDPYDYRINRPGTVSPSNWSLTVPMSLEDLLNHKVCASIKDMVKVSGRL